MKTSIINLVWVYFFYIKYLNIIPYSIWRGCICI